MLDHQFLPEESTLIFFFSRENEDYTDTPFLTERSGTNRKKRETPPEPNDAGGRSGPVARRCHCFARCLGREAAPLQPGSRRTTRTEELTPRLAVVTAMRLRATFFSNLEIRLRRHAETGEDSPRRTDPRICRHGRGGRSDPALRGTPRPEGMSSAAKDLSGRATTSTTPPAGPPTSPTLYTHRESGIPHPPAAGAADGG